LLTCFLENHASLADDANSCPKPVDSARRGERRSETLWQRQSRERTNCI